MSLVSRAPGCRGGHLRRSVVPVQRRCNMGGDDLGSSRRRAGRDADRAAEPVEPVRPLSREGRTARGSSARSPTSCSSRTAGSRSMSRGPRPSSVREPMPSFGEDLVQVMLDSARAEEEAGAARLSASRQTGGERQSGGPSWERGSAGRPPHGRGPRRPVAAARRARQRARSPSAISVPLSCARSHSRCAEGCARSGRPLRAAASAALLDLVGEDGWRARQPGSSSRASGSPGPRRRSGRTRASSPPGWPTPAARGAPRSGSPVTRRTGRPLELGRRAGLTDGDEHGDGLRVHASRGDGQRLGWILTGSPGCVRSSPASSTSPPACR
jgi:hypothetical protein